jgi:hypothetical protein
MAATVRPPAEPAAEPSAPTPARAALAGEPAPEVFLEDLFAETETEPAAVAGVDPGAETPWAGEVQASGSSEPDFVFSSLEAPAPAGETEAWPLDAPWTAPGEETPGAAPDLPEEEASPAEATPLAEPQGPATLASDRSGEVEFPATEDHPLADAEAAGPAEPLSAPAEVESPESVAAPSSAVSKLPPETQRPSVNLARCGGCGHKLAYKEALSGKRVRCPACQQAFVLP